MKKLSTIFKESSENRIKKSVKDSMGFFIVKYSGLSGPDLNSLRQALRDIKSEMFVVRNCVARRALKELKCEDVVKHVEGPCGFIFTGQEPVGASKALYNFSKDHANLKLEGGFLNEKAITKGDIETLAKLPSREVLIAQAVGAIKSPLTGFVMVLKGNLRKLVFCLEQIKGKK